MKLYSNGPLNSFESMLALWKLKEARSRTYVDGHKAFRLKGRGVNNALIYCDGTNVIGRLYSTDLVTWHPNGWMTLTLGGWTSNTTLEAVWRMAGVSITHSSEGVSMHKTRLLLSESREGTASSTIRRSIPFVEGIRVHTESRTIHPDDLRCVPSDVRAGYSSPSKECAAKFRKEVWPSIVQRIKFELALGSLGEELQQMISKNGLPLPTGRSRREVLDCERNGEPLTLALMVRALTPKSGFSAPWSMRSMDAAALTDVLRPRVVALQPELLREYAELEGGMEERGGAVLGKGYYVAPQDESQV